MTAPKKHATKDRYNLWGRLDSVKSRYGRILGSFVGIMASSFQGPEARHFTAKPTFSFGEEGILPLIFDTPHLRLQSLSVH